MEEIFQIPVTYKGEEIFFPAQLFRYGFIYRFGVDVHGQEVFFEPDEEGAYRAVINQEQLSKHLNTELLQVIAEAIEEVLK